jgi:hypothetical protein
VLGGSRLLSDVGGRPTSDLWLGGFDAALSATWQLLPESPQLGWTGVASLTVAADGTIVVAGYQGTTAQSNASVPWVLGVREGTVAWEHVYDTGQATAGSAQFVAARPDGGVLVRGIDSEGGWVRALDAGGATDWIERFDVGLGYGTVAPLSGGGYVATSGGAHCSGCAAPDLQPVMMTVTGYDTSREAVWQVRVADCESAIAAAPTPGGELVVLGMCEWGLGLFAYRLPGGG